MSAAKGKYKPYPKYKDSGVDWLGRVPEHWELLPARRLFSNIKEKAKPDDEQLTASQQHGVIPQKLYSELSSHRVVSALNGTSSFNHVALNDFVISLRSFEGGIERCRYSGCITPAYTILRYAKGGFDERYFEHLMKSLGFIQKLQSSTDNLRDGKPISYDAFGMIIMPFIEKSEQTAIADFIERECGRIDKLVEKKQEFIALLKEKRQALITHAVTKGLDPNVEMKDSGVEWLGKVPKHWKVEKYAWHFKSAMGQTILQSDLVEGGEYPVYSATESGAIFGHINNPSVRLDIGDIVIPARGISIGYPVKVPGKATTTQTTIYSKPRDKNITSTAYTVYYLMGYRPVLFYFDRTAIPQITVDQVNFNPILIPPKDEADIIADRIDSETTRIDKLISKSQKSIELIKERKVALITAAVTGQIDVS